MVRFVAYACIGLGLGISGCSGTPVADLPIDPSTGTEGGAGGGPGEPGSSGDAGEMSTGCADGPGYGTPAEPRDIASVTAMLVDVDDNPVPNEMVQVCGIDLCIASESSEAGGVAISITGAITKPAFKYGEGRRSARFAWLLPEEGSDFELGPVRTVLLPPLGSGEPLAPGTVASSGGLSLLPAPRSRIEIDRLTFQTAEEQALRAVRVPLDRAPPVVESSLGFEIVYAATPTDTRFCPPAALQIENSEGWDPGTEVEVWLHGVDISEQWAPYGGWAKLSDAEVSADGARIETTSPGLPMLGVLGFKRP